MTLFDYKNGLHHVVAGARYRNGDSYLYYFLCGGDCLTVAVPNNRDIPTCLQCIGAP